MSWIHGGNLLTSAQPRSKQDLEWIFWRWSYGHILYIHIYIYIHIVSLEVQVGHWNNRVKSAPKTNIFFRREVKSSKIGNYLNSRLDFQAYTVYLKVEETRELTLCSINKFHDFCLKICWGWYCSDSWSDNPEFPWQLARLKTPKWQQKIPTVSQDVSPTKTWCCSYQTCNGDFPTGGFFHGKMFFGRWIDSWIAWLTQQKEHEIKV